LLGGLRSFHHFELKKSLHLGAAAGLICSLVGINTCGEHHGGYFYELRISRTKGIIIGRPIFISAILEIWLLWRLLLDVVVEGDGNPRAGAGPDHTSRFKAVEAGRG